MWSQTRVHLQKAWLAGSSAFVTDGADYQATRRYNTQDPNKKWNLSGNLATAQATVNATTTNRGIEYGQYETALQYNDEFTARLTAYNYGDRNLDGVEFTYIMPRGVEPVIAEDGTVSLSAELLGAANGYTNGLADNAGAATGEKYAPSVVEAYLDLDPTQVEVEVLQTPYSAYAGYDAPSASQDPASYRTGNRTKSNLSDLPPT